MNTTCPAVRPNGSPDRCPAGTTYGTPAVRPAGSPGVPCWVQNQNQNQTVLKSVVGSSNHLSIHRHSVKASRADAWMAADAAIGGGW